MFTLVFHDAFYEAQPTTSCVKHPPATRTGSFRLTRSSFCTKIFCTVAISSVKNTRFWTTDTSIAIARLMETRELDFTEKTSLCNG